MDARPHIESMTDEEWARRSGREAVEPTHGSHAASPTVSTKDGKVTCSRCGPLSNVTAAKHLEEAHGGIRSVIPFTHMLGGW